MTLAYYHRTTLDMLDSEAEVMSYWIWALYSLWNPSPSSARYSL